MAISQVRFGQALDQLEPTDWERFERLCNAFFASELGELYRSTASTSGDGGRDAELFSPVGRAGIVLQFSIQSDWRSKIRETIKRLKEKAGKVPVLIFATNQRIGALADDLKAELRGKPLLDIRDRDWFLARANFDENRSQAAQELYDAVVAPTLDFDGGRRTAGDLTSEESRVMLLFLELQHDDEVSDKGFTKSCFQALIRAALRHTSAARPLTRNEVSERIQALLPQHGAVQLQPYIDAALNRLLKSVVKHNSASDSYHLAYEEHERLADRIAAIDSLRKGFLADLEDDISSDPRVEAGEVEKTRDYIAHVIELYFITEARLLLLPS